ncbi:hypothetical protein [Stenotrophomonas chelatiphaga]|nr:hypothetical protein [Stenotrophomonas chelatiphaga]
MPTYFKPRCLREPADGQGIGIHLMRVQGPLPDGSDPAQYELLLYRGEDRFGAMGLSGGSNRLAQENGKREWIDTIDMSHAVTLKHVLKFKKDLHSDEDDLSFLRRFSLAVLHTITEGSRRLDDMCVIIFTSQAALNEIGISPSDQALLPGGDTPILAELFIPGRPDGPRPDTAGR